MTPHELLDALEATWLATSALLAREDVTWDAPTGCPGWTVKDQLSHMVWSARLLAGLTPAQIDLPALDHVGSPVAEYMERDVHARRPVPGSDVLAEFDRTMVDALARGRRLADTDETIDGPMGMELALGRYLPIAVFDQWCHGEDIRAALGAEPDLTGVAAEHSLSQIRAGLTRAADRAVEFVLTGPGACRFVIGDGDPVGTVTLPAADLVTLAAGRSRPMAVPTITGDTVAVDALISSLPMTP